MMKRMEQGHGPRWSTRRSWVKACIQGCVGTSVCLSQQPEQTTRGKDVYSPQSAEAREAWGMMQCFASTQHYFVMHFGKYAFRHKAMPDGSVVDTTVGGSCILPLGQWVCLPVAFPASLFFPCCRRVSCSTWHKYQGMSAPLAFSAAEGLSYFC